MSNYISSNACRFYAGIESGFGVPAAANAITRFPAVGLSIAQQVEATRRRDKTGTRTFLGFPDGLRRQTSFTVDTYLTSWNAGPLLSYGALFEAALGSPSTLSQGLIVSSDTGAVQIRTSTPHALAVGAGISVGNEIRFVTQVVDGSTFVINAPFSVGIGPGLTLNPTLTFRLGKEPKSATIVEFRDPASAVSRMLVGAVTDELEIRINGDFHGFRFRGDAAALSDSTSSASIYSFPAEPAQVNTSGSPVPGHLGQVWIGSPSNQFHTLTEALVRLHNHSKMRNNEFGTSIARSFSSGPRDVTCSLSALAQDDAQMNALYQNASALQPMPLMFQLGMQQGSLMGIYLPQLSFQTPQFNDVEDRLSWTFQNGQAKGINDDELFIAFA